MRRVIVDPLMFPWAETYFLAGLRNIYGFEGYVIDNHPFKTIGDYQRGTYSFNFVIEDEGKCIKVAIDWFDLNQINSKAAYDWCDIYGKVNTNWNITPKEKYPKIVCIGPSMGVNLFSFPKAVATYLKVIFKSKIVFTSEAIKYAHYYYREFKRASISLYRYQEDRVRNGYVFFLSTLWYDAVWNNNNEKLNTPRYRMMLACKSAPNIVFEGGFVPHNVRNNANGWVSTIDNYSDCIYNNRMPIKEYVSKLQQSMVAINMPAVVSCHGWKLAEYLALGKCIVSLPLVNDLPYPLKHGENIHFIESPDELQDALQYIYENPNYRKKLERGARDYYEKWCSPESAMRLLGIV